MAPHAHNAHMQTGKDLKLRRVAADVKSKDLAAAMGVSASRISQIEGGRDPMTLEIESRYLAALHMCVTKTTSAAA
jgi:transcriptional regulator with XRE-family HTH domain